MDFFGISRSAAGIGFGLATLLLAGLFLLKPRHRKVRIPSVMLFAAAPPRAKFRELFRRPARWLHFLLLTLMLAAGAAALTEPEWEPRNARHTLIVSTPGAQEEAARFGARLHPRRTRLVSTEIAGVSDRSGALWSALQTPFADGSRPEEVLFFGPDAPPWLPENGVWLRHGEERERPDRPPLREPAYQLFLEHATGDGDRLPRGLRRTGVAAGADAIVEHVPETPEQWAGLFRQLRARHGAYADSLQQLDGALPSDRQLPAGERYRFSPATGLWLLALLLFLIDCRLYSRGKVV